MGPPMKHVSKKVWDGVVMDLNKRELLRKKILPAIASNRGLQRIVSEYQDSLDQLEEWLLDEMYVYTCAHVYNLKVIK